MALVTRRYFLMSTAALASGCGAGLSARRASPGNESVRSPAVGQTWRYAKHDRFSETVVNDQVDQVIAVGNIIQIDSRVDNLPQPGPSAADWGSDWLNSYGEQAKSGPLPSEIQHPWGMVLVDPHWGPAQVYREPVPLWPVELRRGWSSTVATQYKTADSRGALPWQMTMKAHGWESVKVPAGRFDVVRYSTLINFQSAIPGRRDAQRQETGWFAPEVGRWVARETSGTYMLSDSVATQRLSESSYRWELLSWA